jgi:cell wall assembly regulator SMI1
MQRLFRTGFSLLLLSVLLTPAAQAAQTRIEHELELSYPNALHRSGKVRQSTPKAVTPSATEQRSDSELDKKTAPSSVVNASTQQPITSGGQYFQGNTTVWWEQLLKP